MRRFILVISAVLLAGSGCSDTSDTAQLPADMRTEDLPNVPALQVAFTREFLESAEPTREGYYPFLSKTGSYTMDFPEDMVISERSYTIGPDERSEIISLSTSTDNAPVYVNYIINYYNFISNAENSKEALSSSAGVDLEFNKKDSNFNDQNLEIAEFEDSSITGFAAIIWNDNSQQVEIFADIQCNENTQSSECSQIKEDEKNKVISTLKSIHLLNSGEE